MIVTLLLVFLVLAMLYTSSHRLSGIATASVLIVGFVGVVFVVDPYILGNVAAMLGVGRGTDLLLYFSVVSATFVIPNLYFRLRVADARIVSLVRAHALLECDVRESLCFLASSSIDDLTATSVESS